jgi:ATP-dependent RNA helicase RhlE
LPFSSFGLDPLLLRGVRELGFTRPTPIQEQSIPPAVTGRDVLACAVTGSGKTAAFGLPILNRLIGKPRRTTRALILTPTRELCAQIDAHLLDHFRHPYAGLKGLEVLVLDEADRMLDMGFLPDIKRVLRHLPAKRQTLFFSATMPAPIVALTRELLHHPVTINLDRQTLPPVGITQAAYPVDAKLKPALLLALLRRGDMTSALVFTRTKHRANRLADWLVRQGVRAARIHGNRSQTQRTQALEGFKAGRYDVLVATDIAARGIDVVALGHVVNFDVPAASEDYIHRVGRTGRAELTGEAFTFVAPEDEPGLRAIERAIGKPLPRVLLPDFDYRQVPPEAPAVSARHSPSAPSRHRPARAADRGHSGPSHGRSVPDGAWATRLEAEAGRVRRPARSFRPRRRR